MIIFGCFLLRADSDPGGANFYIFVPSLGLPKITARVVSSSSTVEKKAFRVQLLIVYSTYITKQYTSYIRLVLLVVTYFIDFRN